MLRRLLENGLWESGAGEEAFGATLLSAAAMADSAAGVSLLLDFGASVAARDPWGRTPLEQAIRSASLAAARRLLEAGADPNGPESRMKPLSLAARIEGKGERAGEMARLLLEFGADPQARGAMGRRPGHWACERGTRQVALALLEAGWEPSDELPDAVGEGEIEAARKRGGVGEEWLLAAWKRERAKREAREVGAAAEPGKAAKALPGRRL